MNNTNNDVIMYNIANNDVIKNDIIKNDIIKNAVIKNDIIKNDIIKNDIIKNAVIKNNIIKNDIIKNDIIKNNIIKNDIIKNDKDEYLELQTNDECELSLTELDDKKIIINTLKKNIFIPHKTTSNTETNIVKSSNSVENKKIDLVKNAKLTLSIKQLQDIAIELNISLTLGFLKNGNMKYRTKTELFEDIKNYKL